MADQTNIPEEFRSDEDFVALEDLSPQSKKYIEEGGADFFIGSGEDSPIFMPEDMIPVWDIRLLNEKGWKKLEEWVEWLRGAYRLDNKILPCWWNHINISMELSALKGVWDNTYGYTADCDKPTAPGEWHHYLDLALSRMKRLWNGSCTSSEHEKLNEPGESRKRQVRPKDFNISKTAFEDNKTL